MSGQHVPFSTSSFSWWKRADYARLETNFNKSTQHLLIAPHKLLDGTTALSSFVLKRLALLAYSDLFDVILLNQETPLLPIWCLLSTSSPRQSRSLSAASFFAWSYSSPREYLKHVPQESLLSPLGLICYSHEKLAQLKPSPPDKAVTLFSVLRLDHTQLPFYPADDCAYPYSPNYYLARAATSNSWLEITDAHDGSMVMW
ncbi:hypothetical protein NM208_g10627 [Fusarium decemcellulare]|uniref:Uncharacterized protein n=1 Tax=Fusarium decemcellulare TaxID=57161 RepID=A0ACC1RX77_9HYPO|nr:hypothetical protein NM208_g10627 [Fusarium decemcellulare]